ncbi:hypothetical protein Q1695_007982 [Nippostrongylus brasiliensis]|nr:hypothetical protein Q1695_007982 [Nippostrongylus brasiliensis]
MKVFEEICMVYQSVFLEMQHQILAQAFDYHNSLQRSTWDRASLQKNADTVRLEWGTYNTSVRNSPTSGPDHLASIDPIVEVERTLRRPDPEGRDEAFRSRAAINSSLISPVIAAMRLSK